MHDFRELAVSSTFGYFGLFGISSVRARQSSQQWPAVLRVKPAPLAERRDGRGRSSDHTLTFVSLALFFSTGTAVGMVPQLLISTAPAVGRAVGIAVGIMLALMLLPFGVTSCERSKASFFLLW